MATTAVMAESLLAAQRDLSEAWTAIRRSAALLDECSTKLTEEALAALTVTEEVRDKVRRTLKALEEI